MSEFMATSGPIGGSASAQNILSIENPGGSGKNFYIRKIVAQGALTVLSTTVFAYRISRTTGTPTGGSTITAFAKTAGDSPSAVVRSSPTATATGGQAVNMTPGNLLGITLTGAFVPQSLTLMDRDATETVRIAPGESILAHADGNNASWTHFVNLEWAEEAI